MNTSLKMTTDTTAVGGAAALAVAGGLKYMQNNKIEKEEAHRGRRRRRHSTDDYSLSRSSSRRGRSRSKSNVAKAGAATAALAGLASNETTRPKHTCLILEIGAEIAAAGLTGAAATKLWERHQDKKNRLVRVPDVEYGSEPLEPYDSPSEEPRRRQRRHRHRSASGSDAEARKKRSRSKLRDVAAAGLGTAAAAIGIKKYSDHQKNKERGERSREGSVEPSRSRDRSDRARDRRSRDRERRRYEEANQYYPGYDVEAPPPSPPHASDPDEDDLDDLDEMLDEFSSVKLKLKTDVSESTDAASPTSTSAHRTTGDGDLGGEDSLTSLEDFSEEEFQKQLQAGMAELMAQFESIFKGLGTTEPTGSNEEQASLSKSARAMAADLGQDASFQETIRRTMDRMQTSGDQATAAVTIERSEDDFIAEMMKAMKDLPGGDGNEEDFSKLLMGMMEQLTNKEILYDPMKELNDKFPAWVEKNKDTLPKEDLKRYQEQQVLVGEMVTKFEEPTYSDSNLSDREYIVDRMQKMQAAGSPPHDLIGNMPSAKEILDAPDDSCVPQ
ncbi:hypothetical protein NUW58_g6840 [Xylaria curta]|uniref:Uncharacterized protein n=1 Tax=Xylaria curta TaxID=42375 RepID=A0ACC1NQQ8_9PEZI|nr:hypothetical protein NUW58_g6840 [Xylaria curta]